MSAEATHDSDGSPTQNNNDDNEETAAAIADQFGDGGSVNGDYDTAGFVVSDSEIVMWVPEDRTEPIGIPIADFSDSEGWGVQYARVDDEISAIYNIRAGDTQHRIPMDAVHDLAEVVGVTPAALVDHAEINTNKAHFPVLFDLSDINDDHDGRVMICPTVTTESEIHADPADVPSE